MKVILRENIESLGRIGDIVKVSDGYARNFLLPRNLVTVANEANVKEIEHHQNALKKKRERETKDAKEISQKLEGFSCTITKKVGENEKIFGSVTSSEIAAVLVKAGYNVDKKQIHIADAIKQLGVYTVAVKLTGDVTAQLKVWVVEEK